MSGIAQSDWVAASWREGCTERTVLAAQLESVADSIATWGAAAGEHGTLVAQLRQLADLTRHPTGTTTERWTEVRLTGQPAHPTDPPYDFTFRSDRDAWQHKEALLVRARETWTGVTIQSREVERQIRVTDWTEETT